MIDNALLIDTLNNLVYYKPKRFKDDDVYTEIVNKKNLSYWKLSKSFKLSQKEYLIPPQNKQELKEIKAQELHNLHVAFEYILNEEYIDLLFLQELVSKNCYLTLGFREDDVIYHGTQSPLAIDDRKKFTNNINTDCEDQIHDYILNFINTQPFLNHNKRIAMLILQHYYIHNYQQFFTLDKNFRTDIEYHRFNYVVIQPKKSKQEALEKFKNYIKSRLVDINTLKNKKVIQRR